MDRTEHLKIAVVGGGVAGIVAAYLMQRRHDVTLYEKNDYIGGHTNTVVIPGGPDRGMPVDTGFIVLNDRTYPLFNRFLSQLNVSISKTDMSFSYTDRKTGLQYASMDLDGIFAQRKNLIKPSFWNLLRGIVKFNTTTRHRLHEGRLVGVTLGEHLEREGIAKKVAKEFVLPMAGAIWSAPDGKISDFPAETFARFYENHGLLSLRDHPQWYFVSGGSQTYVRSFLKDFKGKIVVNCAVTGIRREDARVAIERPDSGESFYDRVIIAAHADEALKVLTDPSPQEVRLLSAWTYSRNNTVLHRDSSYLPPNHRAWASWNYIREAGTDADAPVTLTYDMTRLQRLTTKERYCVTLNPARQIPETAVIRQLDYSHPVYNFDSLSSQNELGRLNGQRNTYFCGSYFGYGFHEDAVRSAVEVGRLFGIDL
ncbi:MAG TPA: FAD-dependent oxidoreductase [Deltaproteobacteria bacterium]|nr:FAD-dependent oxidoreductase [Deltaproteobacteria bacterium]